MKVLILNQPDRLYLTHQGVWCADARQAKDLSFTAHARNVARGMNLLKYQIVFFFPEINHQIVIADSEINLSPVKSG